jgi:hypothetical protein
VILRRVIDHVRRQEWTAIGNLRDYNPVLYANLLEISGRKK